jgi:hypothetical protein
VTCKVFLLHGLNGSLIFYFDTRVPAVVSVLFVLLNKSVHNAYSPPTFYIITRFSTNCY